jgi:geranylgeranyl reductase family protein
MHAGASRGTHYDAIVVGAGPGGTTTAHYLAKAGVRTLLVDKAVFPRDKVCGDLLPHACVEIARELGVFDALLEVPHGESRQLVLRNEREQLRLADRHYLAVTRSRFDDLLFRSVRNVVDTLEGTMVRAVATCDGIARVQVVDASGAAEEKTAHFVVGADGYSSVVARGLNRLWRAERIAIALRGYFGNVPLAEDEIHFYYLEDCSPGYVWAFPVGDGIVNVGFGVLRRDYEKHVGSLRTWFNALLRSTPLSEQFRGAELLGEVASWPLPLAEGPEPLHGDGIVLVGDAAGLVDPFWGHGIDSAMVSGKLAARAIVAALGGGATRERALQDYTDAVSARFAATWQFHLLLREQIATCHSLLGFTPLELLRMLLGVDSGAVEPL